MIVPAFGDDRRIIPVFSRSGSSFISYRHQQLGHRVPGLLGWGHHMFVSGQSVLAALSSAPSLSDRDPDGHQGLQLDHDHVQRRDSLGTTPHAVRAGVLWVFTIGG